MKKVITLIFSTFILLTGAAEVSAASYVAEASGELRATNVSSDSRVTTLRNYLKSHNSPLSDYAGQFIASADRYGIDWRLVPAISGVESTFGKRIPGGYNAYGWAGGNYRFVSWEDSIEVVSKSLKEDYIEKGAPSLTKIGRRYCPPNPTWVWKVKFLMGKIEPLPLSFTLEG